MELRRKALLLAGVGSCGMAALHFYLPQAYGWNQYVELVPQSVARSMAVIHFLCSFLLLWGGLMTIFAAKTSRPISSISYLILYGLATFWALYVLYEARYPPAVSDHAHKTFLVLAACICGLYLMFLFTRRADGGSHPNHDSTGI